MLRHSKGRWHGRPFELEPWQRAEITDPIFGTLNADGLRQYRTALIELPRKNGKSQIAAGVGLNLLCADGEMGAEVYAAAADKDQARLVFDEAKRMVEASPELAPPTLQIFKDAIFDPNTHSVFRVISSVAATKHGFNPHGVVIDELHAHKNRDLYDVLTTAQGARLQPLTFIITTAGFDKQSVCYELHEYARKVRTGQVVDPTFYSLHYGAPSKPADNWRREATWKAANPAYGSIISPEFLRNEFTKARHIPARQNTFRQLYLNQWTEQAERWLDLARWDGNDVHPVSLDRLHGRPVWLGLDLGSVSDLTALVYVAECESGAGLDVALRCWAPASMLEKENNERNHLLYQQWRDEGSLTITPGNATDYGAVRVALVGSADGSVSGDRDVMDIQALAYDKAFQGQQLAMELADEGIEVLPLGQSAFYQDPQIRAVERLYLNAGVHHGANPIMRWAVDHAKTRKDRDGRQKLDKAASSEKIDPVSALLLAVDAYERRDGTGSVYDDPEESIAL